MKKFMSFLGNVKAEVKAVNTTSPTGKKKERNPITADIRVFKTGAVYPSAKLVQDFELEYQDKDSATPGFGFDVIDGRIWANLKTDAPALFIAPVRRDLGKVDLFASCTYDENNKPVVEVMEQGATTFGKQLLAMIAEIYNVAPTEEQDYVDLNLVAIPEVNALLKSTTNGILHLPKTVSRGDNKGTATYVRREGQTVYGFVPVQLLTEEADQVEAEIEQVEANNSIPESPLAQVADEIENVLNADLAENIPGTYAELQEGLKA